MFSRKKHSDYRAVEPCSHPLIERDGKPVYSLWGHRYCLNDRVKRRAVLTVCAVILIIRLLLSCHERGSHMGSVAPMVDTAASLSDPAPREFYSISSRRSRHCRSAFGRNIDSTSDNLLTVIAYAGSIKASHPGYRNFISSLRTSGYKDIVIKSPASDSEILSRKGRANFTAEALFWVERLRVFQQTAASYPADHVLIFCDAFDVLFGLSPELFLSRFRSLKSDIVFSSEMLCDTISCRNDMHLTDWFRSRTHALNPYKYLNAGMFAGRAGSLTEFISCALSYASAGRDDQTSFSFCFRDFSSPSSTSSIRITLDYYSLLFGNVPPVESLFLKAWDMDHDRHIRVTSAHSNEFNLTTTVPFLYRKYTFTIPTVVRRHASWMIDEDNKNEAQAWFVSPVAIHFPGMAYRPTQYSLFNPCQQFLRWQYIQVGQASFTHGQLPNAFYPYSLISRASDSPSRIVRASMPHGRRLVLCYIYDVLLRDHYTLSDFLRATVDQTEYVRIDKVYVLLLSSENRENVQSSLAQDISTFEKYFDLEVITVSNSGYSTTSGAVSRVLPVETDAETVIIVYRENGIAIPQNFIDTLYMTFMRSPGYVYGFGGWNIENSNNQNGRAVVIRSAGKWSTEYVSVDVLDYSRGLIFQRGMVEGADDLWTSNNEFSDECLDRGTHADEDVRLSAHLSKIGVPRVQLPMDGSRLLPKRIDTLVENVNVALSPSICFVMPLLSVFELSLVHTGNEQDVMSKNGGRSGESSDSYSANAEAPPGSCDIRTFDAIPIVDNLPGFSWQSNWDPDSFTSPCTAHLLTRIAPSAMTLGTGQYMAQNQTLRSPGGLYFLKLNSGARLCLYNATLFRPVVCLEPPLGRLVHGSDTHYAALHNGELCVYAGQSPLFGSTKTDSGHREVEWCTSEDYPSTLSRQNPHFSVAAQGWKKVPKSGKKSRMDTIKQRVREKVEKAMSKHLSDEVSACQQRRSIDSQNWNSVYLHVSDSGIFGLYYTVSSTISPSDLVKPIERVNALRMGKCFN